MKEVVDRLEMCGKPGLNKVTKYTANQMFDPEEFWAAFDVMSHF